MSTLYNPTVNNNTTDNNNQKDIWDNSFNSTTDKDNLLMDNNTMASIIHTANSTDLTLTNKPTKFPKLPTKRYE